MADELYQLVDQDRFVVSLEETTLETSTGATYTAQDVSDVFLDGRKTGTWGIQYLSTIYDDEALVQYIEKIGDVYHILNIRDVVSHVKAQLEKSKTVQLDLVIDNYIIRQFINESGLSLSKTGFVFSKKKVAKKKEKKVELVTKLLMANLRSRTHYYISSKLEKTYNLLAKIDGSGNKIGQNNIVLLGRQLGITNDEMWQNLVEKNRAGYGVNFSTEAVEAAKEAYFEWLESITEVL